MRKNILFCAVTFLITGNAFADTCGTGFFGDCKDIATAHKCIGKKYPELEKKLMAAFKSGQDMEWHTGSLYKAQKATSQRKKEFSETPSLLITKSGTEEINQTVHQKHAECLAKLEYLSVFVASLDRLILKRVNHNSDRFINEENRLVRNPQKNKPGYKERTVENILHELQKKSLEKPYIPLFGEGALRERIQNRSTLFEGMIAKRVKMGY